MDSSRGPRRQYFLLRSERILIPIETVGEKLAVVDNDGAHVATIQVTRVEVVRFADAPDELALTEAAGDLIEDLR